VGSGRKHLIKGFGEGKRTGTKWHHFTVLEKPAGEAGKFALTLKRGGEGKGGEKAQGGSRTVGLVSLR